jgi:hypothetical protein
MRGLLLSLTVLAALDGCDSLKPDTGTLWSTTAAPVERPRCDACHGNPPSTGFHKYHIDTVGRGGFSVPGIPVISCITCHSATIAHAPGRVVYDSAYVDTNNVTYHTQGWPWVAFERGGNQQFYGTYDSMIDPPLGSFQAPAGQAHPDWIAIAPVHPDSAGHMNGRKDIRFQKGVDWTEILYAADGSDSLHIQHVATFDPVRLSCGMVACHHHDNGEDSDTSTFYVWTKKGRKVL